MLAVNGALLALLTLSVLGCTLLGPVRLDLWQALQSLPVANPDAEILLRARLPRVLLGVAIGGGMAACGVVLQALLRNPLACPQMIGVSGGASLGGILGLIFLPNWLLPIAGGLLGEISWVPLAAFLGALLSMVLIYRFSLFQGRLHPYHLLLCGVIFNSFIAAVIMFLNSIVDFYQAQRSLLAHGQPFHPCLSHRRIHLGLHSFRFSLAVDQRPFPQSHHPGRRSGHAARCGDRRAPAADLYRFFADDRRYGLRERHDRLRGIDDSPRHATHRRQRPSASAAGVLSCRRDFLVLGGYSCPHPAGARGAAGGNRHGLLWRALLSFSSLPRRR